MKVTSKQIRFRRSYRSMDLSALESVSKALERSLDFWGALLLGATALVVLGLIVEYWHEAKEFWIIVRWPMASFPWDKLKNLSGGVLVTVGVALELFFTYKASTVETLLRGNNHKIEALLTDKAAEAEKARAKIEAKVAWRSLTPPQANEMGLTLRHFGKLTVAVGYEGTDAESSSFASDIADALQASRGLKVEPMAGFLHTETPTIRRGHIIPTMETGVLVAPTKDKAAKSLALAIFKELNDRGFDARVGNPEEHPIPQVKVDVGPRPIGPQGEYKLQAELEAKTKSNANLSKRP